MVKDENGKYVPHLVHCPGAGSIENEKTSETKRDNGYAYCFRCQEDFIDDLPVEMARSLS